MLGEQLAQPCELAVALSQACVELDEHEMHPVGEGLGGPELEHEHLCEQLSARQPRRGLMRHHLASQRRLGGVERSPRRWQHALLLAQPSQHRRALHARAEVGEDLHEHHSQRIDVAAFVVPPRGHLGGGVEKRPDFGGRRQRSVGCENAAWSILGRGCQRMHLGNRGLRTVDVLCEPKVPNLDDAVHHEDIVRLDVAVDDTLGVQVCQSVGALTK
eukprot:211075-Rhodomonas_salina.3